MITSEEVHRIETTFKERCKMFSIKYKSKKFYELQAEYFIGAMTALNINFPHWSIAIMSGREIIDTY